MGIIKLSDLFSEENYSGRTPLTNEEIERLKDGDFAMSGLGLTGMSRDIFDPDYVDYSRQREDLIRNLEILNSANKPE